MPRYLVVVSYAKASSEGWGLDARDDEAALERARTLSQGAWPKRRIKDCRIYSRDGEIVEGEHA